MQHWNSERTALWVWREAALILDWRKWQVRLWSPPMDCMTDNARLTVHFWRMLRASIKSEFCQYSWVKDIAIGTILWSSNTSLQSDSWWEHSNWDEFCISCTAMEAVSGSISSYWPSLSHLWQFWCQYSTRRVGLLGKTLQWFQSGTGFEPWRWHLP